MAKVKAGTAEGAGAELPRRRRVVSTEVKRPIAGQKNLLITSALPYVNNVPHLGNIIGCVLSADVFARWARGVGHNAVYICGTDEYGTATETKALAEGMTPREICNKYHAQHKAIYEWFDIGFDYFGRTSCEDPKTDKTWPQTRIAQDIFTGLQSHGMIQEQTSDQPYCPALGMFLSDRQVEGTCPKCGSEEARGDQCDACGSLLSPLELVNARCALPTEDPTLEVRPTSHLHLDLPKLTPRLQAWIDERSPQWTTNSRAINKTWMDQGLETRAITRDLKWGTPVPAAGYEDKVFYVWYDAPIGYISISACYSPEHWKEWWQPERPEDVELVQFMGKDNVPFHTVIFPACLLGSGMPWTTLGRLSTTEYLQYEAGKFSKSRGVGVFGDNAAETGIPSEVWRYYLLAVRPETNDTAFQWNDFADRNNNELMSNLGNFVHRCLSFSFSKCGGVVPSYTGALSEREVALVKEVNTELAAYHEAMDAMSLRTALAHVMRISAAGNVYLQDTAPWVSFKSDLNSCYRCLHTAAALVHLLACIAEPFMPGFTDKVFYMLDLPHSAILREWTAEQHAAIPEGQALKQPQPIFSLIAPEQVEQLRTRFNGKQVAGDGAAAAAAPGEAAGKSGKGAKGGKGAKPAKGGKGGKAAPAADVPAFSRIDLRVGKIVRAWKHPEADKLYCEEIDLGEEKPRQIASGLRAHYADASDLEGQLVVVVANLKPRKMVGFESQGMVLCGQGEEGAKVRFLTPPAGAQPGDRVVADGHVVGDADEVVNPMKKKNPWVDVAPHLATDGAGVGVYQGVPLMTAAGPCVCEGILNCPVG